jgi:hypothetical protein
MFCFENDRGRIFYVDDHFLPHASGYNEAINEKKENHRRRAWYVLL